MSLLYKECARIVSLVIAGKGSVKTLCLSTRNKAKTKVYAIVFNVLQSKFCSTRMFDTQGTTEQNTVFYEIYPTDRESDLEKLRVQCLEVLSDHLNIVWNGEPFILHVQKNAATAHLHGKLWFGNSVEDEWYVVWLLLKLSKSLPVAVKVWDEDGCFPLIEAADVIPLWLTPDNSDNRLMLFKGGFILIPLPKTPAEITWLPQKEITIKQAIHCIHNLRHDKEIGRVINLKLQSFPIRSMHRIKCHLPIALVHSFTSKPPLISSAINTYLQLDSSQIQHAIKNRALDWTDSIDTNIQLTRCQYAQLFSQRLTAEHPWSSVPVGHVAYQAHDFGAKISCGAEKLLSFSEGKSPIIDKEYSKFISRLKSLGYFGETLPGSIAHSEQMKKADMFFQASSSEGSQPLNLIDSHTMRSFVEQIKETPSLCDKHRNTSYIADSESDAWMDEIPEDVQKWFLDARETKSDTTFNTSEVPSNNKEPSHVSVDHLDDLSSKLDSFVNNISSHEGAEVPEMNLNVDDFLDCIKGLKEQVDKAAASAELSESDDTSSLNSDSAEEMQEYMDELDKQLRGSTLSDSFLKHDDGDLDIDLNLVSNVLKSFSAETGLLGPASSILSSMGVHLPRDEDTESNCA